MKSNQTQTPLKSSFFSSLTSRPQLSREDTNFSISINDFSPQRLKVINYHSISRSNFKSETNLPILQNFEKPSSLYKQKKKYESPAYLYKKIFRKNGIFRNRKTVTINNIINLDYADDFDKYEFKLSKENEKLVEMGKPIKHSVASCKNLDSKLKDCRDKILFMKGVIDYSYPGFVVNKIKQIDKQLKEKYKNERKIKKFLSPVDSRTKSQKELNENRKTYLYNAFTCNKII